MSVNIKYKNNSIATLTDTGTKILKTSGKYCEADIIVENTKDGGGGAMTSGKLTPTSNIASGYTITHNLGVVPKLFVLFLSTTSSGVTKSLIYEIFYNGEEPVFGVSNTNTQGYTIYQYQSYNNDITSADTISPLRGATSTTIEVHPEAKDVVLKAGKEYMWVACA